jgi:hypothetical protein
VTTDGNRLAILHSLAVVPKPRFQEILSDVRKLSDWMMMEVSVGFKQRSRAGTGLQPVPSGA